MEKYIPSLLISMILVGCSVKSTENENLSDVDSLKTDAGSVNDPAPTPEQLKQFLNSRVGVSYEKYKKEAFILPRKSLNIFAEDLTTIIKTIQIDIIQPFTLSQKTKTRIPEMEGTELCDWSNFVKGYFKDGKENIVSGKWVYEAFPEQQIVNTFNGDSLMLYVISNFETGPVGEDELTGCGGYNIMIIKNLATDKLSFIKVTKEQRQFPSQYALLEASDGAGESITTIQTVADTVIVSIAVRYQEGSGTYKLKIVRDDDGYMAFKTDIKEVYP